MSADIHDADPVPAGNEVTDVRLLVDGLHARYLEVGAGPPLVLLHGGAWGERAEASWGGVLHALAAATRRRVIAPDWLGFGGSALVRDFAAPERRMVDHLAGLLTHLRVTRADVVALSMAGSLVLADQSDDRPRLDVGRLVLVSAGAPMRPEIRQRLFGYDGTVDGMRELLRLVHHDPDYAADDTLVRRWHAWSREPGVYEAFAALALRAPDAPPPPRPRLDRVTAPTLLCVGAHDRFREPGWEKSVAAALPDVRVAMFDHSGHCPQIEEPERFVAEVRGFLSEEGAS